MAPNNTSWLTCSVLVPLRSWSGEWGGWAWVQKGETALMPCALQLPPAKTLRDTYHVRIRNCISQYKTLTRERTRQMNIIYCSGEGPGDPSPDKKSTCSPETQAISSLKSRSFALPGESYVCLSHCPSNFLPNYPCTSIRHPCDIFLIKS